MRSVQSANTGDWTFTPCSCGARTKARRCFMSVQSALIHFHKTTSTTNHSSRRTVRFWNRYLTLFFMYKCVCVCVYDDSEPINVYALTWDVLNVTPLVDNLTRSIATGFGGVRAPTGGALFVKRARIRTLTIAQRRIAPICVSTRRDMPQVTRPVLIHPIALNLTIAFILDVSPIRRLVVDVSLVKQARQQPRVFAAIPHGSSRGMLCVT